MIESYENSKKDRETKGAGAERAVNNLQQALDRLGLGQMVVNGVLAEQPMNEEGTGRIPATKSAILSKAYNRTLTHFRPYPPMALPKPYQNEVCAVLLAGCHVPTVAANSLVPSPLLCPCQSCRILIDFGKVSSPIGGNWVK